MSQKWHPVMEDANNPPTSSKTSLEETLQTALHMTEVAIDLKERWTVADRYLTHLKQLLNQAGTTMATLQSTSKFSLQQARKILISTPTPCNVLKNDYDKLLGVIDKQLSDFEEIVDLDSELSLSYLTEKIKFLEGKQRSDNSLPPCGSNKSVSVDEKYPENWSRDSSIDLNNVMNLPPVPEDVFTSFSSNIKPKRSSSLSSLKSMRKVKLFLQRAENSDEDDPSSDPEDHELGQKVSCFSKLTWKIYARICVSLIT